MSELPTLRAVFVKNLKWIEEYISFHRLKNQQDAKAVLKHINAQKGQEQGQEEVDRGALESAAEQESSEADMTLEDIAEDVLKQHEINSHWG